MRNALIEEIVALEWSLFQQVENAGGRAGCQDDPQTFARMRAGQCAVWPENVQASYLDDLRAAAAAGRNLLTEKYARMMASTHPAEYRKFQDALPPIGDDDAARIDSIVAAHLYWKKIVGARYPRLEKRGRPLFAAQDTPWNTSFETYLRGELATWSAKTIALYAAYVEQCLAAGRNLAEENLDELVRRGGFASLDEAEREVR